MNSNLRAGLAASAVGALALTGLAVSVPAAQADADAPIVRLLSQRDGQASLRPDGYDLDTQRVTLVAETSGPADEIYFEYHVNPQASDDAGGWLPIPGAPMITGRYATLHWSVEVNLFAGSTVALRAVSSGLGGTSYDTRRGVTINGPLSDVDSVALGETYVSSSIAYFAQPYADSGRTARLARVSGTTSATTGDVELSWWRSSDASFQGTVAAAVTRADIKVSSGAQTIEGGEFTGVLDITAFDLTGGEALAVRAERGSDTVMVALPLAQNISRITRTTTDSTGLILDVTDGDVEPVPGAEVRRLSDGGLLGYTDAAGQVVVEDASAGDEGYYVNVTDVDAFEEGTDFSVPFGDPVVPVPTSTQVQLADGPVFDDDEYAEGDVALQVLDQLDQPVGEGVELRYAIAPSATEAPSELSWATTDEDGRVILPFDPTGPDGEYTIRYTLPGDGEEQEPVTFVAGDATLELTPGAGKAASGGEISYAGLLTVQGEPLAGRRIDLAYARGVENVPGRDADAGIVTEGGKPALAGVATTDDDGEFAVTVDDLAEAGGPTETGRLAAAARAAKESASATAAFGSGKGTARLRLGGSSKRGAADKLTVTGPSSLAGETYRLFSKVGKGKWKALRSGRLNATGDASFSVKDRNGKSVTRYYVRLLTSARVTGSKSNVRKLP